MSGSAIDSSMLQPSSDLASTRVSSIEAIALAEATGRVRRSTYRAEPRLPTGPPPVGTWRIAACRDHWSKYELGWHISPIANQHELAPHGLMAGGQDQARLAQEPQHRGLRDQPPLMADNRPHQILPLGAGVLQTVKPLWSEMKCACRRPKGL